jgi:hypothetical protein
VVIISDLFLITFILPLIFIWDNKGNPDGMMVEGTFDYFKSDNGTEYLWI